MIVLGGGSTQSTHQNTLGLLNYPRLVEAASIYQYALKHGIHYTIFVSGGGSTIKTKSRGRPSHTSGDGHANKTDRLRES